MASYKFNLKLCRALEKQPILYNQSHEDYRKRLASENCWDLVASEVGDSVEKCKRRWRQIRTDYSRWMCSDEQRQINGLKRPPVFYLAEELAFLKPHLFQSDQGERECGSAEREQDRQTEPSLEDSSLKEKQKDIEEAVEELPLSHFKRASNTQTDTENLEEQQKSKDNVKENNKDTNKKDKKLEAKQKKDNKRKLSVTDTVDGQQEADSIPFDDKKQSEGSAAPTASVEPTASFKQPEFFIKQSNNSSSNNLIIGKKRPISPPIDPLFHQMADDSPDETASIGGGRRLRRPRIKHNAIEKVVTEQRVTRLRRKSIAVAAANSIRSSTSPVKMSPLPRTSLPAKAQAKTPPKPTKTTVNNNDDIFPRPRAVVVPPTQQQLVAAQRLVPGPLPQQQRPHATTQALQLRTGYTVPRMQAPTRLGTPTNVPYGQTASPAVRTTANVVPGDLFKVPSLVTATSTVTSRFPSQSQPQTHQHSQSQSQPQSQALFQPQQQSQRLASNSNTLVISATSCVASSIATSSTNTSLSSFTAQTASITASPIASVSSPLLTLVKRCERGMQTESPDSFSDDHFLDMVRPQMREMNPRQKMHFKQKVFHALMETFDDATDFPNSGEVQHFNINTPSGYDHVTDRELRLIRELASLVTAVKHTPETTTSSSSPASNQSGVNQRVVPLRQQQVLQRVIRPTHGGMVVTSPRDEKKMYRVMPVTNNNNKVVTAQRRESIDSNSSNSASTNNAPARVVTFVVPANSSKTAQPSKEAPTSLTTAQSPTARVVPSTATVSKTPILVRQMGRRYSVCGAGGGVPSPNTPFTHSTTMDAALLKRRIAASSLSGMPPQQKARYSSSPVAAAAAGQALAASTMPSGESFLVPRSVVNGGQPRQKSPTGPNVSPLKLKTPQKASIQNRAFKDFVPPTYLRGNSNASSGSGSGSVVNYGGVGQTSSTSPQKRNLVIANVKGNVGPLPTMSHVRPQSAKQPNSPSSGANVANLLSENVRQQPDPRERPSVTQGKPKDAEMAGIIAADDFDMGRLKREPQDIMDDNDILGM